MDGYSAYPQQRNFPSRNDASDMLDMSVDGMNMAMDFSAIDTQQYADMGPPQQQQNQQNDKNDRRKSMPAYQNVPMQLDSIDTRRFSMLDYANASGHRFDMDSFQFNPQTGAAMNGMMRAANTSYPNPHSAAELAGSTIASSDLAVNTQFANQNRPYHMQHAPGSNYASPLQPVSMDMAMNSGFANPVSMPLEMQDPALAMMGNDFNMFPGNQFGNAMMNSPIAHDFAMASRMQEHANDMNQVEAFRNAAIKATADVRRMPSRGSSKEHSTTPKSRPDSAQLPTPTSLQHRASGGTATTPETALAPAQKAMAIQHEPPTDAFAQMTFPWPTPPGGFPSSMNNNLHINNPLFKNVYSSSGFDLLDILTRVKHRPNKQIELGDVDFSCAFVVCDAQAEDCPIVYCTDNFERLTGYTRDMIVGRNCRFLQAPDGQVKAGQKRKFCDDDSVNHLREAIVNQTEAQVSLINYRRGGQAFMNLLTMIPISAVDGGPIKFFVGFQVDLVETPASIQNRNTDGTFRVNYHRAISMPNYRFDPGIGRLQSEVGQTISKDEVSSVLATYGAQDSEISRRIWDKVLLENTDDVIHVLSLKGLFLYLSPSSNKVLEYDPSELVGTGLSSVCHPSDIVPVTRELKETTNGSAVNVVFRIRRKKSGYMWFEGHGSLHTEQGKGRKCIILVGRKRPVYTLSKAVVGSSGGIGDNELWSKISTSGMFLFVSSNIRALLDRQPDDLIGTNIQQLMRPESKQTFGHALEIVRTGRKAEAKHEMVSRRGQVLQAFTTIYPGDAVEGEKPTFVVAQTRLLKYTRTAHGTRPSMYANKEHNSNDSRGSGPSILSETSSAQHGTGNSTPGTTMSDSRFRAIETTTPIALSGQNRFPIGHQDHSLASEDNVFDELKTTRSSSWQYELRQMEKRNRYLAEEVQTLLAAKKKRKRRKGAGQMQKDCANCHTRTTPEWRRGPSGNRDLCNSCGLRWAKQVGRVSPRHSAQSVSDKGKKSVSPRHAQPILPNVLVDPEAVPSVPVASAQPKPSAQPMPTALAPGEKRSPTQAGKNSHAAKLARMEATAPRGYGGGIPTKIDEGVEPKE